MQAGRRRVRYLAAGAGWPLLLVHGFPLNAEMWRPQLERVPDNWRFIAPDLRGFGPSPAEMEIEPSAMTMDEYAGDLIELRQQHILRAVWSGAIIAPVIAVLAGTVFLPWTTGTEVATSLPARAIGQFFGDNFQRCTNQRLRAITGDDQLASLIALDSSRPHVLFDATPKRTPWLSREKFNQTGGIVVWRAADTAGTPPPDIIKHFPGLVPEVPQTFDRLVNCRVPILRIGWAIVRPKAP